MCKYFRELDNPNNFMTLCHNDNLPKMVPLYQFNFIDVLENPRYILNEP